MFKMAVNDDNFPKGPDIGMNVLTTVADILCHHLQAAALFRDLKKKFSYKMGLTWSFSCLVVRQPITFSGGCLFTGMIF